MRKTNSLGIWRKGQQHKDDSADAFRCSTCQGCTWSEVQLLPLHQEATDDLYGTTSNSLNVDLINGTCDRIDSGHLDCWAAGLEDSRLRTGNCIADLLRGETLTSEGRGEVLIGFILEDLAGNAEGDSDGSNLSNVHEANGRGDFMHGACFGGGQGVSTLCAKSSSNSDEETETIYPANFGLWCNGMHDTSTDQDEDATYYVPMEIVSYDWHHGTLEHHEEDGDTDEWQLLYLLARYAGRVFGTTIPDGQRP